MNLLLYTLRMYTAKNDFKTSFVLQEGQWLWTDGSKFNYRRWGAKEPNNLKGREHCLVMNWRGKKFQCLPNNTDGTHINICCHWLRNCWEALTVENFVLTACFVEPSLQETTGTTGYVKIQVPLCAPRTCDAFRSVRCHNDVTTSHL